MASGEVAYSDLVPLVMQTSLNESRDYGVTVEERHSTVIHQPLSMPSITSLEDAFSHVVMSMNPGILRIEIDESSREEAVSKVMYRLKLFGEPRPSLKILTDVRAKEYTNYGTESDAIEMATNKRRETCLGNGFRFSLLQGLQMGDDGRIGPSIFNAVGRNAETLLMFSENDSISEKVTVPPRTRTTVTVKTNLVKYEGEATIDVQANARRPITYKYLTTRCFGCCKPKWQKGAITMGQLFRGQPNFKVFGPTVHYTAKYNYTYFGEQFDVQKTETKT